MARSPPLYTNEVGEDRVDHDYTLVARQLDEIRRCIDGIRPFRFDLE